MSPGRQRRLSAQWPFVLQYADNAYVCNRTAGALYSHAGKGNDPLCYRQARLCVIERAAYPIGPGSDTSGGETDDRRYLISLGGWPLTSGTWRDCLEIPSREVKCVFWRGDTRLLLSRREDILEQGAGGQCRQSATGADGKQTLVGRAAGLCAQQSVWRLPLPRQNSILLVCGYRRWPTCVMVV